MNPENRFRPRVELLDDRLAPSSIHSAHHEPPPADITTTTEAPTTDVGVIKFPHGHHWHLGVF